MLLSLRERLWAGAGTPESLLKARRLPGFTAWIAWDADIAVGFAEASLRTYAEDAPVGPPVPYLEGVFVRRRWRRGGVAMRLVAAVERWAREGGATHLASDALLENRRSHRVHRALGFEETARIVTFLKPLG